jgi:hypothetical protein
VVPYKYSSSQKYSNKHILNHNFFYLESLKFSNFKEICIFTWTKFWQKIGSFDCNYTKLEIPMWISDSQKYSNKIKDHKLWRFNSIMCNFFQPNLIVLPCLDLTKIENSKKLTPKLFVVASMVIKEIIKPYKKVFDRFHTTMSTECFKIRLN